jgi:hypothetical protein
MADSRSQSERYAELHAAAQRVLRGERDAAVHEMHVALERAYQDRPDDPIATILLPAYRLRSRMLDRRGR